MKAENYGTDVIRKGDTGSIILDRHASRTRKNSPLIKKFIFGEETFEGIRLPPNQIGVAHSIGGNPKIRNLRDYCISLLDRLVEQATSAGATPVAFADVVDSRTGDPEMINLIGKTLADEAIRRGLVIVGGENAILGDKVNGDANLSGTMISMIGRGNLLPGVHNIKGSLFSAFDPKGGLLYVNSDGEGTKSECNMRAGEPQRSLRNSVVMKVDDLVKRGARLVTLSDVVETNGEVDYKLFTREADSLCRELGVPYIIQREVTDRINGYKPGQPAVNVSGSAVSIIDEARLRHPLIPQSGDHLIGIRGSRPGPRSNGISVRRQIMVGKFGLDWHRDIRTERLLEFLSEPSILFYPCFSAAIDQGVASAVFHMSGGAYDGKLARPLAKHGLFVDIADPFPPSDEDMFFVKVNGMTPEIAYGQWPMGTEGFITTSKPRESMELIRSFGLEPRALGMVHKSSSGVTGVRLRAYDGTTVYFPGNDTPKL